MIHPEMLDQCREDKLVKEAASDFCDCHIKIDQKVLSRTDPFPVDFEASIAIDRTRGYSWKEKEVGEELGYPQR